MHPRNVDLGARRPVPAGKAERPLSVQSDDLHGDSCQLVEQRLCFFEIGRVEAFGEPAVDWREKVVGLGAVPLVTAEPGEDGGLKLS